MSQSAKPALQLPIPHWPAVHAAMPFATKQMRAQAPQLRTSLSTDDSHPFAASPSQFANPLSHATAHAPILHATLAFGPAMHAFPQPPQFFASVASVASQPFFASASQSPNPPSQP